MTTIQSLRLDGLLSFAPGSQAFELGALTAIIEREGDGYVSLCPELDVASQGATVNEARDNLQEALTLFFETASPTEIDRRSHDEVYVNRVEVAVG